MLYGHYMPTVILIIIGIPSPTHSFTLGLIPSFSPNPSHRSLSFSFFRFHYMDSPRLLTVTSEHIRLYLFIFFLFYTFSSRFRAVGKLTRVGF